MTRIEDLRHTPRVETPRQRTYKREVASQEDADVQQRREKPARRVGEKRKACVDGHHHERRGNRHEKRRHKAAEQIDAPHAPNGRVENGLDRFRNSNHASPLLFRRIQTRTSDSASRTNTSG